MGVSESLGLAGRVTLAVVLAAHLLTLAPAVLRASTWGEAWQVVRYQVWGLIAVGYVSYFVASRRRTGDGSPPPLTPEQQLEADRQARAVARLRQIAREGEVEPVAAAASSSGCCGGSCQSGAADKDAGGCGSGSCGQGQCADGDTGADGFADQSASESSVPPSAEGSEAELKLKIFYATTTGTAKGFAETLLVDAEAIDLSAEIVNIADYEPEDLPDETSICVFVVATHEGGTPPENAAWMFQWLEEASTDFRMAKMNGFRYAVFGLGDSNYPSVNFNRVARNLDTQLRMLCARPISAVGYGDQNVAESRHGGLEADFDIWKATFWADVISRRGNQGPAEAALDPAEAAAVLSSDDEDKSDDKGSGDDLVDVEDIGSMMNKLKAAKAAEKKKDREMITPKLREALTKQNYKLIGSHSGVKLCRWTKSMLRGRGGCYKHTFYGIESHRCMETTPSLACANKCVFCWRHHTNPVGTEWKWQMDPPDDIVNGAMENHYDMIKQFRGVPGVDPERFKEGLQIRHCALSLVGEPIMYPEINRFVDLLHERKISSFLVTNAQFPEAIRDLSPVCQLYVSVDAATKDSLKKIDRPLFSDFWPRFLRSLEALRDKQQRTVYRLTVVKEFNDEDIEAYADLVQLGHPEFIEVKGVTYCGSSKASTLTMGNVPWHNEVTDFVDQLAARLPDYEVACEHEHSNCLLIAHKKFLIGGVWHTWIDYDKFHEMVGSGRKFVTADYMAPTPEWAVRGHPARGFDPVETRHKRSRDEPVDLTGC
eukprot:m.321305 g.321305  ORF g.321305 m.321305 type:complete len:769 (+) comp19708_c16_seq1:128-2434(+)